MGNNSSAKADGGDKDGTYRVGICQLVQHESLDAATQGFEDALEEEFGTNVEFDLQNAQNDSNTCSTIINSFVSGDVDLILANATASLQAAAAGTNEIPVLGTCVTEYGIALGLDDFNGTVGGNISRYIRPCSFGSAGGSSSGTVPGRKNSRTALLFRGTELTVSGGYYERISGRQRIYLIKTLLSQIPMTCLP